MVPLGHKQHQTPGGANWRIKRQRPGGAKMAHKTKVRWCQDGTCHYDTYNVNDRHHLELISFLSCWYHLAFDVLTRYLMCCHNFFNWDRKPNSGTLLALYCTKSWWEQVVTDNQSLTEKPHKYNHVIIKGKELIFHQLSYQWTENSALWSALRSQLSSPGINGQFY